MKETLLKAEIFDLWDMDADSKAPRAFHALMDYCEISNALNCKFFDDSQTKEIQDKRNNLNMFGPPSIEGSDEEYIEQIKLITPSFLEDPDSESWQLCYALMDEFDEVKGQIKNEELKVDLNNGSYEIHNFSFDEGAKPFQEFLLDCYLNETYQNLGWKHDDSIQRMSQIDQLLNHPDEE